MHYYNFNIGDYVKSTQHLSIYEDLAYRRLLDRYYDTEKPLEADVKKLCRFVRLTSYEKETQAVLEEFFSLTKNGWIQKRVKKELDSYSRKAEAARANGKKGGRPKKTQLDNLANPEETQSKAKQEPINNKQETINNNHKTITNNQSNKASAFVFSSWPNQASDEVWKDFVKHRNSVKAKVTQTVINRMATGMHEMVSHGWTVDDVLAEVCTRGWKSFKPEWLLKEQIENSGFSKITQQNLINTAGWADE